MISSAQIYEKDLKNRIIAFNSKINNLSQRQIKFNYYLGLAEYEEMAFLIHALKKDDVFVDCGANLGLYTILASKVIGANSNKGDILHNKKTPAVTIVAA